MNEIILLGRGFLWACERNCRPPAEDRPGRANAERTLDRHPVPFAADRRETKLVEIRGGREFASEAPAVPRAPGGFSSSCSASTKLGSVARLLVDENYP